MATATSILHGKTMHSGAVWTAIPALAIAAAIVAAPPNLFRELTSVSLLPAAASAASPEAPQTGEGSLTVNLQADPPAEGTKAIVDQSPIGFRVGKTRHYHIDYKVFGSSNRASYDVYVDGVEELEGKPYYKVTTMVSGTPRDRTEVMYYRASDEGVHRRFTCKEKEYETVWYPAPFQVGHSWDQEVDGFKHAGRYTAIEEVDVNGEKVTCLKVELDGTLGRQTEWLAPGRGVVKVSQQSKLYSAVVTVDPSAPSPPRESVALNE